jgi:putative tryptophan/tyrosine transport system substrate-binding protein
MVGVVLSLGEPMRRRNFIKAITVLTAWPLTARAQQADRMRRLGVLMAVAESDAHARNGISILQERLLKLGWKEGNNIRIDYRWGNGNPDRIQELAKELVELQPDVLIGHTTPSAKGLLKQTIQYRLFSSQLPIQWVKV